MNVQELFNCDGFAKQVSGFGELSKWEEVTDDFKKKWEAEHPIEIPEGIVENN